LRGLAIHVPSNCGGFFQVLDPIILRSDTARVVISTDIERSRIAQSTR
jgi:hypothetical protein